ncbi:MAG TPA: M48 family metallopeptidase [Sphingomonadaceae bacterium]|nr:M48 family metallopeptidase [Sphingomonadaceae bacterium]
MKCCLKAGVALALALAGVPAPVLGQAPSPETAGLQQLQAEDLRVATIAYRLAVANRELCLDTAPLSGLIVHDASQYAPDYRPAAIRLFGLGGGPGVEAVVADSAAARAGVRAGDELVAVNDVAVDRRAADGGAADYAPVATVKALLAAELAKGPVDLRVVRGGETRMFRIVPVEGCASTIQLLPSDRSDAGADGRMISITTAMVDYADGDDELAVVIAHEMAHNALRHRARLDAAGVSRGIFRIFGKNAKQIRRTEEEADRLGLYLMARAGFDIEAAPRFWRRYGKAHDLGFLSEPTHPRWKARVEALQATIHWIREQQARGAPIRPPDFPEAGLAKGG